MKVVVLGAGFGGLELSARLSEALGDEVDVTLIDRSEGFVFGFSKLDVMFGRTTAGAVLHPYRDVVKPGVSSCTADITAIDPVGKRVETTAGPFEGDVLVVALGADLDPAATPGLLEGGHDFYTEAGAFAPRHPRRLRWGPGGRRRLLRPLQVPAGAQRDGAARARPAGAQGRTRPLRGPPRDAVARADPAVATGVGGDPRRLRRAGHRVPRERPVRGLDPDRKVVLLGDEGAGDEMGYDLFLAVPEHKVPAVVSESGMTEDGWIPVDSLTLETRFPDVYAVGDVTSVGTPKAGVFSERQAGVVADRLIARARGDEGPTYDGLGMCYLEFGAGQVAGVEVTFLKGQPPTGTFSAPSEQLAAVKGQFGTDRIRRWFGRDWSAY